VTRAGPPAAGEQASLELAAEAGIHALAIPTPFLVGRVNCYLLDDDPLTLIDTGPNSGKSLDQLEHALAAHERAVEDLELIILTHQHMDHIGLLEILARRSGAEVAALHLLAGYLNDFTRSATADDDFAQAVMRRHGVPGDLATALGSVGAAFRAFGSRGRVTRELHDGEELEFRNRSLEVLHRPGHSPSDTIFWDAKRRILIAGDHLLAHISSNPLISRPLPAKPGAGRPRALIQYIDSLRATRTLPADLVLTGHGPPIRDHVALIDERLALHRRRAEKILEMLQDGPLSAYDLAVKMWGNVAVTQAYLTLSEVLGHLDVLLSEGRIVEQDSGPVALFAAAAGGPAAP
jgi:glyoxylase-like metal-dependent hydrolase (beta-lactamase superfamily II)